jgi:hypothetical protein
MTSDVSQVLQVSDASGDVPLACSLTEAELRERGEENTALFARVREVRELPDGYRFAFAPDADGVPALMRFITAERACCPFFTFELQFAAPHQAIWLAVRGSEEVKGIVRDDFVSKVRTGN